MAQGKLNRGLRAPVRQHSNPKPDLAMLAGRTRCCNCRELGHFSRNCPKKRVQAPGNAACDLELPAIADVLAAHESHLERLMRKEPWKRLTLEQNEADEGEHATAKVVRYQTRVVRKQWLDIVLSSAMWKSVEESNVSFPTCAQ